MRIFAKISWIRLDVCRNISIDEHFGIGTDDSVRKNRYAFGLACFWRAYQLRVYRKLYRREKIARARVVRRVIHCITLYRDAGHDRLPRI